MLSNIKLNKCFILYLEKGEEVIVVCFFEFFYNKRRCKYFLFLYYLKYECFIYG